MGWQDDRTGHEAWVVGYAPRIDPETNLTHYDVEELKRGVHTEQLVRIIGMACSCGWRSQHERVVFSRADMERRHGEFEPAAAEWDGGILWNLNEFDEEKVRKHWKAHLESVPTPTEKNSFGNPRFDEPAGSHVVEQYREAETRLILVVGERFTRGIEPMAAVYEAERDRGTRGPRTDWVFFGLRAGVRDITVQVLQRLVDAGVFTVTDAGRVRITHDEEWLKRNAPRVLNMRAEKAGAPS